MKTLAHLIIIAATCIMLCSCFGGKKVTVTDQKTGTSLQISEEGVIVEGSIELNGVTVEVAEEE